MESLMNKSWWLSPLNIEKYNGIKVHNEHTQDNHNSSDMLLITWSVIKFKFLIETPNLFEDIRY